MGWLDLIGVGLDIATLAEVNKMRREGTAANVINALLREAKNQVYKFKESAEDALLLEAQSPKLAAAALKLQEQRILESGLTPDIFTELADKDFIGSTIRLIRVNSDRLYQSLPPHEKSEVQNVVSKALLLPEYDYYLENISEVKRYEYAQQEAQSPGKSYRSIGIMLLALGGLSMCLGAAMASTGGSNSVAFLSLIALIAGGVLLWKSRGPLEAQKVVNSIKSNVDINHVKDLRLKFGSDERQIAQKREAARAEIRQFFDAKPANVSESGTPLVTSPQYTLPVGQGQPPAAPVSDQPAVYSPSPVPQVEQKQAASSLPVNEIKPNDFVACPKCGQSQPAFRAYCVRCHEPMPAVNVVAPAPASPPSPVMNVEPAAPVSPPAPVLSDEPAAPGSTPLPVMNVEPAAPVSSPLPPAPEIKFNVCEKCGNYNPDRAASCLKCGNPLSGKPA